MPVRLENRQPDGSTGQGPTIDTLLRLDDISQMRRFAPLSWAKLMGLLLVMAALLQHPVRSHENCGAPAGKDAELVAGGEAIEGLLLALQPDGVRVVRPVRPVERSVDPELARTHLELGFDRAALPRAATDCPKQSFVPRPAPGLVGICELRI